MTAAHRSAVGTVNTMRSSAVAGAVLVSCGAAAIAFGARGQWVTDDPLHVWVQAPITTDQRNWLLGGAIALAACSLVGLVGMLRWLVVMAWVHAGGALLFTMLDVQNKLGSSKPPTGARLGWGPWVGLGGIVVAVVGLMAMLRHDLDDAPVPEPKRARRAPAKKAPATRPVARAAAKGSGARPPATKRPAATSTGSNSSTNRSKSATKKAPAKASKQAAGRAGSTRR